MAKTPATRARVWNKTFSEYLDLKQRLLGDEAQVHSSHLETELARVEGAVMELPAPNLAAVRHKLEILWEADLEKPDTDGAEKALIIEDLEDLEVEMLRLLRSIA